MDYEQKYKQLHKFISDLYSFMSEYCKEKVEGLIPELCESEDERIKKELIFYLGDMPEDTELRNGVTNRDVLVWLEKQGQTYTKKDVDDAYVEGIASAKNELKKQGESELKDNKDEKIRKKIIETFKNLGDGKIPVDINYADIFTWLEKQGEQKPFDYENINIQQKDFASKKPKFNVGDWIVNKGHSYLIADIDYDDNRYLFEIGGYTHEQLNWEYINNADKKYHLWTIKDAKEGDVLMSRSPFIYGKQCPYGGLNWYNNNFIKASSFIFTDSPVHPATKEQRDLLFQKMHEAGYTFDFEKKELKKIDNEEVNSEDYGIDGLWHAQRILEKTLGSVDGYQSDDSILDHRAAITAVKKLHKQKTDWSEEDSVRLQRIIDFLWYNRKGDTDAIYQQEQDIDWLKNFNQRVTWKPSDKQITVLELASKYERVFTPKQIDILIGLKEQLNKLREE